MTAAASRWLALAGLAALSLLLLQPRDAFGVIGATPLAGLIISGVAPLSRWWVATAILMLPYFSYGIMEMISNPDGRRGAVIFSALTVMVFLAALDSGRRR